jgi:hypothetical protein
MMTHVNDLGGADAISAAEHNIIRRIATITTELELLEMKFALANDGAGGAKPADLDLYVRSAGGLRRLFEVIGMKRVARDITPTIAEIARAIDSGRDDEPGAEIE